MRVPESYLSLRDIDLNPLAIPSANLSIYKAILPELLAQVLQLAPPFLFHPDIASTHVLALPSSYHEVHNTHTCHHTANPASQFP